MIITNFPRYLNRIRITSHFTVKFRSKHNFIDMTSEILHPPHLIRGITHLDKSLFTKQIKVPALILENQSKMNGIMPHIKKKLLKMANLKAIREYEGSKRSVLFNPCIVTSWNDLPTTQLESKGVNSDAFIEDFELELTYDNWRADELLKFILPEDKEGLSSFSRVGHIIHLNLKEHLLPYKKVIAEILLDKMSGIRTVVNKSQTIDNVYRNFSMELLIGDAEYEVTTKENGIEFAFDFSKVYWNPRLSSEHDRIVKILNKGDVLYDVFAGVGPFAIPAGKKGVEVYTNDLNPDSYKWLRLNAIKNKVQDKIQTFNKDGREFILNDVKSNFLEKLKNPQFNGVMHFVMNLPAMAVEFLDVFHGFLSSESQFPFTKLPVVHVYCFAKGTGNKDEIALNLVNHHLGMPLPKNSLIQINFVRNVAPNKDMMRVDFYLTPEILFAKSDSNEPPLKKSKVEENQENGKAFNEEGQTTGSEIASTGKTKEGNESFQTTIGHECKN